MRHSPLSGVALVYCMAENEPLQYVILTGIRCPLFFEKYYISLVIRVSRQNSQFLSIPWAFLREKEIQIVNHDIPLVNLILI